MSERFLWIYFVKRNNVTQKFECKSHDQQEQQYEVAFLDLQVYRTTLDSNIDYKIFKRALRICRIFAHKQIYFWHFNIHFKREETEATLEMDEVYKSVRFLG